MGKLISFRLKQGSLKEGFVVRLEIAKDGVEGVTQPYLAVEGNLAPFPNLEKQYLSWQQTYRNLGNQVRLGSPAAQVTHISQSQTLQQCQKEANNLKKSLSKWYHSDEFTKIRETLLRELEKTDEIRLLIQTDDLQLRQLPWHLFFAEFLAAYAGAEIALSPLEYGYLHLAKSDHTSIKILGIFGSDEGIDINTDKEILANLPNAEPHFLVSPTLEEFYHYLYDQPWDILFFAGHSSSQGQDNQGNFKINATEAITIAELTNAINKAVKKGLRLAVFNSCDGLGIATALSQLQLPQIIFMGEMVPDVVAQMFLREFLSSFSRGESLYLSVREAREKLQPLEKTYPCATWLPVILQNPACLPLTWQNLHSLDFLPNVSRESRVNLPTNLGQIALYKAIGKTTLVVEYQELTQTQAEVLVSFDDIYLSMSNGVAAELLRCGGKVIKEEAHRRIPQELGKVAITTAGELAGVHIFHGAIFDLENPQLTNVALLQQLTRRCLELADAYQVKSIAFPALVTDRMQLTPQQTAVAMMIEIVKYLQGKTELEKVTMAIAQGKEIRGDLLSRFYGQVSEFLDMHQQMETRQDLLSDLLRIYGSRKMEKAAEIVLSYQRKLDTLKEDWTQKMLGLEISSFVEQEYPIPEMLPPVAPLPAPELPQSFNHFAAEVWDKLQMVETEEELQDIFTSLEGDIDAIAQIDDQLEVAIAAAEAKAKKVTEILKSQVEEYKSAQSLLHKKLIEWHQEGKLPQKATGAERKISFQAYPKVDLLVDIEELPLEYRTEKISYTANKKLLKEAIDKGIDVGVWAKLDPNLKVKFGFKS